VFGYQQLTSETKCPKIVWIIFEYQGTRFSEKPVSAIWWLLTAILFSPYFRPFKRSFESILSAFLCALYIIEARFPLILF
jgi:hypothetical protein